MSSYRSQDNGRRSANRMHMRSNGASFHLDVPAGPFRSQRSKREFRAHIREERRRADMHMMYGPVVELVDMQQHRD